MAELKHIALELGSKKDILEADMAVAVEYLSKAGVGMHEPLVDSDGFPRSDVDIIAIRKARNFVARGRNDLKDMELKHEELIAEIHGQTRPEAHKQMTVDDVERAAKSAAAAEKAQRMQRESTMRAKPPFLKVVHVAPRSPGFVAGLVAGDVIVKYGSIEKADCLLRQGGAFEAIGSYTRESEGRLIDVWVIRDDDGKGVHELALVPQRGWGGDGLLGCSFDAEGL